MANLAAKGFDLSDPKNQKIMIAVMLLGAAIYLFFSLSYSPNMEEIGRIQQRIDDTKQKLLVSKKKEKRSKELAKDIVVIEKRLRDAREKLPQDPEVAKFLYALTAIIEQYSDRITIRTIRPGKEIRKELYTEFPIRIELRGNYNSVVFFIEGISRLQRIVNISNMEFKFQTREEDDHTVTVTFSAVIYTLAGDS